MSIARRAANTARRLLGFGRLALVVGLLAVLWIGTVNGVERASKNADERRASDRSAVAAAFADSVRTWIDAGITEAVTLSHASGSLSGPRATVALESFIAQPRQFSRSALVFAGRYVTAASARHTVLTGLQPKPCTRADETGATVADHGLEELVAAASSAATPIVSQIFDVPGDCRPAVAVAVSSGAQVAVVLGDLEEATSRLAAGSLIGDSTEAGGTRILLVTGDLALEPRQGIVSVPPRVASFVRGVAAGGPRRTRYAIGEQGDAEVWAASAPVNDVWSVVLEQDAALFDIELQSRPSLIVATVLTVVFGIVFALLAAFDSRRKRAHRRSEAAKNAFFSIAGHELRTPLTVITGFVETLSENWNELDVKRRRTLIDRLVPQTRRLDRLVERLLVAASIQAETNTRPQVREVDPLAVLERVAEHFRPEAPLHTIAVDAGSDITFALADERALDQVLGHLVENAIKYTPSGGRIGLSVVSGRRGVDLVVEDEGVGLPADRRRIFDKFEQGESVTKRVHDEGGVGLGLYIVQTLVEDMGGSVRAESRDPEGARFIVSLKASESARKSAASLA